jgi:hypothetical protein
MAATYRAVAQAVTFSTANKVMFQIFNATGSGVVIRVYRVWMMSTVGTGAVTGILQPVELRRISAISSVGTPTAVVPFRMDTSSAAVHANVTINYGNTTTGGTSAVIRRMYLQTDEVAVNTAVVEEMHLIYPLQCIFNAGYGDGNCEPLVLRETFGFVVNCAATTGAVGSVDIIVDFTQV